MSESTKAQSENTEIDETKALLDTKFDLDKTLRKNIVLFVGNTGSGKSTVCQILAGNPNLKVVGDEEACNLYITDGNVKVSDSTTESKTLLPELVPIPNTNTVLADCPGFSDTRSAKYDIAAAVFIKQLLSEAEQVKIMVVIPHHSVRPKLDRRAFSDLLAYVANFINDIYKYKDSIGLLVTKVDNAIKKNKNGQYILVPDNKVIAEIGEFLHINKTELNKKNNLSECSVLTKQIELVNIFLNKSDNNKFTKICIFRRPEDSQKLNQNKLLMQNKCDINKIINNVLKFKCVSPDDFELSLSQETMNFIFQLRKIFNKNLLKILEDYIDEYHRKLITAKPSNTDEIKTVISRSMKIVRVLKSNIGEYMEVAQLLQRLKEVDPEHPAQQYADWKKEQQYMTFLESINPSDEGSNDFEKYKTRLDDFKIRISNEVKFIISDLRASVNTSLNKMLDGYIEEYYRKLFASKPANIDETKAVISRALTIVKVLASNIFENMEVAQLMKRLEEVDVEHPAQQYADWKKEQQYMQFLEFIDATEDLSNDFEKYKTRLNDFKIRISNEVKLIISELRKSVNNNLTKILDGYIGTYYQKLFAFEQANTVDISVIKSAISCSLNIVNVLESNIVEGMRVTQLMKCIKAIDPEHPVQQFTDWKKEQHFIQYLESIDPTEDFSNDFEKYNTRLNEFKIRISNEVKLFFFKLRYSVNNNLTKILDGYIGTYYQKLFVSKPAKTSNIDETKVTISRASTIVKVLESNIVENMEVAQLMNRLEAVDPEHPAQQFADWKKEQQNMKFLESIDPTEDLSNDFEKYNTRLNDFKIRIYNEVKVTVSALRETSNINLSKILDRYIGEYYQKMFASKPTNIDETKAAITRCLAIVNVLESSIVENMEVAQLMQRLEAVDPKHPAQKFADWKKEQHFIQYLESIDPTEDGSNEFQKYQTRLSEFKNRLACENKLMKNTAEKIIDRAIENVISEVISALMNDTLDQVETSRMKLLNLAKQISEFNQMCLQFKTEHTEKILLFKKFLHTFKLSFKMTQNHDLKFRTLQTDIDFFKDKLKAEFSDGKQAHWLNGFNKPVKDMAALIDWYLFLDESLKKMFLADLKSVEELNHWEEFNKLRTQLGTDKICNRIFKSRPKLSRNEQADLEKIIASLDSIFCDFHFSWSELKVEDDFVKLSRVITEILPNHPSYTDLYIFASQVVCIDASLEAPGKNVYIISPLWKIEGEQTINLRGLDGKHQTKLAEAGYPGWPGGNFVGIGGKFDNDINLTVNVSGGRGGNGGDGVDGEDGHNEDFPFDDLSTWMTLECHAAIIRIFGKANIVKTEPNMFKVEGQRGAKGTKGGDGGRAGYGGPNGSFITNAIGMRKHDEHGEPGNGGKGGKGGLGGKNAPHRIISCACLGRNRAAHYLNPTVHNYCLHEEIQQGQAENGADGMPNNAGDPVKASEPLTYLLPHEVCELYTQFIQQKKASCVHNLEFLERYVSGSTNVRR